MKSRFFLIWFVLVQSLLSPGRTLANSFVPLGTSWQLLKGASEASAPDRASWRQIDFDASAWSSALAPFSYGGLAAGTELSDMRGSYTSVFLRRTFQIDNPADWAELDLSVPSGLGFVAWINGREAARQNLPLGDVPLHDAALTGVEWPLRFVPQRIVPARELLVSGENVLALQAFSAGLDAASFAVDASLGGVVDELAPSLETIIPEAGRRVRELTSVEVRFSEPVAGVDSADLLVNGAAATNVVEFAPGQFVFSFPQPPDGTVAIRWATAHGITDLATRANGFEANEWIYVLDSGSAPPELIISEFMAENNRTLNDEDGDQSDWIELFNGDDTPVNLDGWFLTDDSSHLAKWRFPNLAIAPGEFLVVFASEKNKTNVPGRLHTNFKLSSQGEYLALVSPRTNIVSEFAPAYPAQRADVSYGRVAGASETGYFVRPTPGSANAVSGTGFAPEVSFSRVSGTFVSPFQLSLSTVSNAVLRYTLDGSLPTNSSPVYVAPLPITNSVQVRARTYVEGLLPGPPRSETFLLLSNNLVNFSSDLPVLIIHSLGKGTPSASRQNFAHVSLYEPVEGFTSLTNPPTLVSRAGIKLRGSSTEGLPKSSYALEFWDEFGLDIDRGILGLPADSDWVLYAPNQFEPVLIHNPFIHQLSRDMHRYSPRTRFVEVYIVKSAGQVSAANYNGIYVLEEKIKIAPHRVNIDKLEPEHVRAPEVTGGYLMKVDRLDPGDSGLSAGGQAMAFVDPKEKEIKLPQRDPQEQYIRSYFAAFGKSLTATNWLSPVSGYANYIDVDAWIDFHVLEVLSGNVDAIVLSTYFHKPRSGKIVFGPHWDFDRALGSTDGRDANPRVWQTGPFFSSWWNRLFRDPDFWQKWIDRYQELRRSHFAQTNINALIERLADEVRQAQPRERQKWRIPPRGGSYQGEVNLMKNWLSNRMEFIDRQLVQPPKVAVGDGRVTPGFMLQLSAPTNATVYYTLDGADPRLPQGGLSPGASIYTGPILIERNVRVVARSRNLLQRQTGGPPISSPWSSAAAVTLVVAPPPLLLTELMFHPEPPPAGSTNSASDFEYLELKNISDHAVDLTGYRVAGAVDFVFTADAAVSTLAAGERVLLVRNRAAFLERYPGARNIAGEFAGSLENGGGQLTMTGPLQEPIFSFAYEDSWELLADGFGFSLALADESTPGLDLGTRAAWRLSASPGGSPGELDPPSLAVPHVLVNELLPNPGASDKDVLELFNASSSRVNIGGWFITDEYRAPKKFRIPAGVEILPGGYLVLNTFPLPAGSLSFSRAGEQVYLFSADANGNLTGWVHGFEFRAAEEGVSFGRHVKSTGEEAFVAQVRPTPGEANSGPRVPDVVISELMLSIAPEKSGASSEAFVELFNPTAAPVPLFDPAHPANTWLLRGAVDFDFPTNLTVAAASRVVVVGFDPQTEALALARFRSRYGLDEARTTLLGPWRGGLDKAAGVIRLFKQGEPQPTGAPAILVAPEILLEQVSFSNATPVQALQTGAALALVRRDPARFADDPANWGVSFPSPGDADSDGDGLPDAWEARYGLDSASANGEQGATGDPDHDGFSNLQELLSGTGPRDPASHLSLEAVVAPGGVQLSFPMSPGRAYTLEYRDSLAQGPWRPLRAVVASDERQTAAFVESSSAGQRFYRLKSP